MFCSFNTRKKEIKEAYMSKHNSELPNQVILLMITDGEKWHYVAVKCLSRLLQELKSNKNADYHYMNYLYSFRTESKFKSHENVCKDHDYCHMTIPQGNNNALKYN